MASCCTSAVRDALKSFFEKKQSLAEDVLTRDDEIDRMNVAIGTAIKARALQSSDALSFEAAVELIRVCKNLERIADLASNIAEEALFWMLGKVVKHHRLLPAAEPKASKQEPAHLVT
jgi:phosphate transport system protein